jgi:hypothetical protein
MNERYLCAMSNTEYRVPTQGGYLQQSRIEHIIEPLNSLEYLHSQSGKIQEENLEYSKHVIG